MLKKMIKILYIFMFVTLLNASDDSYLLNIKVDKEQVYLGDKIRLVLSFKYMDLEDYELADLKIDDFEVKELDSVDYKTEDNIYVEEINYELVPQKSGNFKIGNFKAKIETISKNYKNLNNRSKYTKKLSIYSNTIKVQVKSLPENISAIGNYVLVASVDKQKIKVGEIVTFRVELKGVGNIKNLDAMKLKIKNASSFLVMDSKNSKKNSLSRTFEIIAEDSYTIPSFTLDYFDKELGIKKTTQSKLFHIDVLNAKKIEATTSHIMKTKDRVMFFFIGVFSAFCLILIYKIYRKIDSKKNDSNFIKVLKNSKSKNELYKKLVVFLGINERLDILIFFLESDEKIKFKKIKKEAIEITKELELKLNKE